ncbi:MAG TPA: hypothetical protein DEA05_06895 [Rhodobacteraceae bacterium]|nr:hypothetical protein [Paracoccaceae bacterium]
MGGLTYDDLMIVIHGNVIDDDANHLSGSDSHVTIGETGSWTSFNPAYSDTAIFLAGGSNQLSNFGQIVAQHTIAVLSIAHNAVVNTGVIEGASGVFMGLSGGAGDQLVNSGTISANDYYGRLRGRAL